MKEKIQNVITFMENHVIECPLTAGCGRCDEARQHVAALKEVLKDVDAEVDRRIKERQLTDEEIEKNFTTPHYHYEKGHYYKVRKDRIFGAKWYRSRLTQKTDNLKENNNNGSTN